MSSEHNLDPKKELRYHNVAQSKTFRNIVRSENLNQKAVLDVGCSYGEFLIHFGPGSVGVSVSQKEVAYGKLKGVDIRYGNIESDDLKLERTFDVVFANNILEHLYAPHNFLCKIKEQLSEKGMVIIGVPCIPKIVSLLRFAKFQGSLDRAHINFYTRDTLVKTVERAGYTIHAVRSFHFSNAFLDHLLNFAWPHYYIIASPDPSFTYSDKRMNELKGYKDLHIRIKDSSSP